MRNSGKLGSPRAVPCGAEFAFFNRRIFGFVFKSKGKVEAAFDAARLKGATKTRGPLNHQRAVVQRVIKAQLLNLAVILDAVEVHMGDHQIGRVILLDQREGGAGDFTFHPQLADQGPRQGGFACAQITLKGDHVAGLQIGGQPRAKRLGCSFVCKVQLGVLKISDSRHGRVRKIVCSSENLFFALVTGGSVALNP